MQCITKDKKYCDELLEFHRAANTDTIQSIALWQEQQILPIVVYINSISVQQTSENLGPLCYFQLFFCLGTYFGMATYLAPTISITSLLLHSVRAFLSLVPPLSRVQGSLLSLLGGAISSAFYLSSKPPPPQCWISRIFKKYVLTQKEQKFEDFTIFRTATFAFLDMFATEK